MKEIMKCIIVDDEPLAIKKLERLLKKVLFIKVEKTLNGSVAALKYMQTEEPDLVFMDVMMEDINGLTAIEMMKSRPIIILTTAYENYALKAYEMDICDYLLKPFDFNRLYKACLKAHDCFLNKNNNNNASADSDNRDFIFIKTAYKHQKLCFSDILYIQGMRDYLRIFTTTGNLMVLQSFQELEANLPKDMFYRVHKSFLVSIPKIESIEKKRIYIKNEIIPISDSYFDDFMIYLKNKQIIK
ncbi:MAG TPA: LytTR family DNA-binding domain-containing protein [Bacteroidales bacterium]|nr:LytTR family DNA-binding domain-containing protein [Bacteroidales bacterium]